MADGYKKAERRIAEAKRTGATDLDLSSLELEKVPLSIIELRGLETLDLGRNGITDISFLGKLTGLQSLYLRGNQISDYSFLENLTGLKTLDLRGNQITDISFLENLASLQKLILNNNEISDISFLANLTPLQSLEIGGNQISDISILANLRSLRKLNLGPNQINDVSFVENLTSLQTLDLYGNQISDISYLANLRSLQTLNLSYNQISDISYLANLRSLQELYLSANQISDISILENLLFLQRLYLGKNRLSNLSVLEKLPDLKSLDLEGCEISDLTAIPELSGLRTLYLENNGITDISPLEPLIEEGMEVHLDFKTTGIVLKGNKIERPPESVVKDGREAILSWFRQLDEQGVAPLYEAKLMILGQGGAGKTTFAELLMNPEYKVGSKQEESTLGIEIYEGKKFKHKRFSEDQNILTRLWDFGGQNIQKMLHQFFITEDCLYVLVCDQRKENADFDYWFQIIDLLGPGCDVIVLENQMQAKGNNLSFPINKYSQQYNELSLDLSSMNLKFIQVRDRRKWELLIDTIEDRLSDMDIVNRPVPAKWPKVRQALLEMEEMPYIKRDDFYELCKHKPIELTEEESDLCLAYLKSLGDLVYFDDRELSNYIFLDHNWLTEGVYFILTDTTIQKNKGRFTKSRAYKKWSQKGYTTAESKKMLLSLMLKDQFDLCYELKKDTFITPLLLPDDKPDSEALTANLHFRYQYGFMPHGLFSRTIVRLHKWIDGEKVWKTGARLRSEMGAIAEVQHLNDKDDNRPVIDIKVKGSPDACKDMADFIRFNIKPLHDEFKHLKVSEMVGCNCAACKEKMSDNGKPTFYNYTELLSRLKNGVLKVYCENAKGLISIGEILNDLGWDMLAKQKSGFDSEGKLSKEGLHITQIVGSPDIDINPHVEFKPYLENKPHFEVKPVITTTVSVDVKVEVGELLDQISGLKDDLENELVAEGVPEKEVQKLVGSVELAEQALEEVEESEQAPKRKAKSRIKRLFDDLQDENSPLRNGLAKLRKGRDYGVKMAESYNKVATKFGLQPIPEIALDVIKAI